MTAQIGETLILNGKRRTMDYCPPLPPDDRLVIPTTRRSFEATIGKTTHYHLFEYWTDSNGLAQCALASSMTYSTACWREYHGTWKLEEGLLYLVDLKGRYRLASSEPLFADWVTGVLRIKYGRELCYVHMGFGSVTEYELQIHIENGRETGRRKIDNRGKKHDPDELGWANLPGSENRFPGDGQLND